MIHGPHRRRVLLTRYAGARGLARSRTVARAVAVAFAPSGALLVQTRAPATLVFADDGAALACGGGDRHGHTSQLAPVQLDDLVAYLETL